MEVCGVQIEETQKEEGGERKGGREGKKVDGSEYNVNES